MQYIFAKRRIKLRKVNDIVYIFLSARIYEGKIVSVTEKVTEKDTKALSYEVRYVDFMGKTKTNRRTTEDLYDSPEEILNMIMSERFFRLPKEEKNGK